MAEFHPHDYKCPFCPAEYPDWKKHAVYDRYLISFENGITITYRITITRYRCQSCGHTHAILPELIIPYQSYSLLFIIAVMRDYFIGSLTIESICIKYDISVSTLYSWKKLFLRHKKLWLGLLEDASISSQQFLHYFLSIGSLLYNLKEFFLTVAISFIQGAFHKRKAHHAPG